MAGVSDTQRVNQPGREEAVVRAGAHPVEHERPEEWGWHGETGKLGRVGAWIAGIFLVLLMVGNEPFPSTGHVWVMIIAGVMVLVLAWDVRRRKNAWRSR